MQSAADLAQFHIMVARQEFTVGKAHAAYLLSSLQGGSHHEKIGELFARTGFWDSVRKQPFSKEEWRIAVQRAPWVKEDFYTILSERDAWPEFARMIALDPVLIGCFE